MRDAGAPVTVVRTVHHVDDFTTPALIDCQRRAIFEPDRVLVVSEYWRELLRTEYDVESHVVANGVDPRRFGPLPAELRSRLRKGIGAENRFLFLAVGGVEPRKGTVHLFRAMSILKDLMDTPPVLAVVGGHSFQDYADYRDAALSALPALGLELGTDVVLLGTVPDSELSAWYRAADALAFPSVKEGWGLAVLEAMSAELPVIASDLPVFKEYLTDRRNALLTPVADAAALARGMRELAESPELRTRLRLGSRPPSPGSPGRRVRPNTPRSTRTSGRPAVALGRPGRCARQADRWIRRRAGHATIAPTPGVACVCCARATACAEVITCA
ncbi:glycosyltransferase [Streptomyces chiangmaiensis]